MEREKAEREERRLKDENGRRAGVVGGNDREHPHDLHPELGRNHQRHGVLQRARRRHAREQGIARRDRERAQRSHDQRIGDEHAEAEPAREDDSAERDRRQKRDHRKPEEQHLAVRVIRERARRKQEDQPGASVAICATPTSDARSLRTPATK